MESMEEEEDHSFEAIIRKKEIFAQSVVEDTNTETNAEKQIILDSPAGHLPFCGQSSVVAHKVSLLLKTAFPQDLLAEETWS